MYRQASGVSVNELSSWLETSPPTFKKHEEAGTLTPSDSILQRLEAETGIPADVWSREDLQLPDNIQRRESQLGRKPKVTDANAKYRQREQARRIAELIKTHYADQREFAGGVYLDEGRLSKLLSNKIEITDKELLRIARNSGASIDWLRNGEGPMMEKEKPRTAPETIIVEHDGQRLGEYLKRKGLNWTALQQAMGLASLSSVTGSKGYSSREHIRAETRQKIADALKVSVADIFAPPVSTELAPYFDEENATIEIPHLPEHARAGLDFERFFEQPIETTRIWLSQIPHNLRHRQWVDITVNGDSMEPLLRSGDKVLAYWLGRDEWDKVHNRVAIVQYAGHVVIKRIKNNRLYQDKGLYLHSENSETAETFFVPIEDLQHIFLVKKRYGDI